MTSKPPKKKKKRKPVHLMKEDSFSEEDLLTRSCWKTDEKKAVHVCDDGGQWSCYPVLVL